MRCLLIDTNAYVAFKKGDVGAVQVLRHAPEIGLNSIVLGELLAGFACGNRQGENRKELAAFLASPRVRLVETGQATADALSAVPVVRLALQPSR